MRFALLVLASLLLYVPARAQTELATEPRAASISGATAVGIPLGRGDAAVSYGINLEGSTRRLLASGTVFGASSDDRQGTGFGLSLGVVLGDGRGGDAFTTLSGEFSQFRLSGRITRVAGATFVHTRRVHRGSALDIGVQAGAGLAAPVTTDGGTNEPQASATLGLLVTTTGPVRFAARPTVGVSATPQNDSGVVTVGLQVGAFFGPPSR